MDPASSPRSLGPIAYRAAPETPRLHWPRQRPARPSGSSRISSGSPWNSRCRAGPPFWVRAGSRSLVGVPCSLEVNDISGYLRMNLTPDQYAAHICRTFDGRYREGADNPTVLALPVHPYLRGYPARAAALEDALQHIKRHPAVWWATGRESAAEYARQHPPG